MLGGVFADTAPASGFAFVRAMLQRELSADVSPHSLVFKYCYKTPGYHQEKGLHRFIFLVIRVLQQVTQAQRDRHGLATSSTRAWNWRDIQSPLESHIVHKTIDSNPWLNTDGRTKHTGVWVFDHPSRLGKVQPRVLCPVWQSF